VLPAFLAGLTWIPALLGLGALVRHEGDPALRPGLAGLFGLAVAGAFGTWLNFAVALSPAVSALIWVGGSFLFLARWRWLTEAFDLRDAPVLVALLAALAFAMRHPFFQYDTNYYHLQALGWLTEGSIVPGIANVHFRLGFNSLWTVVAAALEHPLAAGRSAFFLNQLPIVFAGQVALVGLKRLVAGDRSFANLLLAGSVLPMASATFGIGGLYSDYTLSLVVYLAIALWARAWESGPAFAQEAVPATLLSAFAPLLKLSAAALPAAAAVVLVARRKSLSRAWWLRVTAAVAVAVVPWAVRGVLLSGCIAFPAEATCIGGLPWTVPAEKTRSVSTAIRSWAQSAVPVPGGNWSWLSLWPDRIFRDYPEATLLAVALGVGLVLWLLVSRRLAGSAAVALAMAGAGTVHWFLSAPDPRFALGFLYILGLGPLLLALSAKPFPLERGRARAAAAGVLLVAALGLAVALDGHERTGTLVGLRPWRSPAWRWPTRPRFPTVPLVTESGLGIRVASLGEACGAEPHPCTPPAEFDPALRFDGYFHVAR
jgi:hypothetical protein